MPIVATESPFSSLGAFQYSPLKDGEFRTLKITRLAQKIHASYTESWAVCELVHESISHMPKYNALSYVWGPQKYREHISINGKSFSISVDLSDALCCMFHVSGVHVVWIDAICINQGDDKEKATQIPFMKEIYMGATCVVAWLGREKDDSDILFICMDELSNILSKANTRVVTSALTEHGLPPPDSSIWFAIDHFFYRPWFLRLWVFQEIILAKKLVILCETRTVSWESLVRLVHCIQQTSLEPLIEGLHEMIGGDYHSNKDAQAFVLKIDSARETYHQDQGLQLVWLLRYAQELECRFKVDRVNAMLGLVRDDVRRRVKIDYDLEDYFWGPWIWVGKIISVLEKETFYYLFGLIDSGHKCPHLPSWFPDLRWGPSATQFGLEDAMAGANGLEPELCTFQDSNKLCVLGFEVDTSEDTSPSKWIWPESATQDAEAQDCLEWYRKTLDLAKNARLRSQDYLKDYLLTITAGLLDRGPDKYQETNWLQNNAAFSQTICELERWRISQNWSSGDTSQKVDVFPWVENVTRACMSRSFFTTSSGRIGLGPLQMAKGDKICVFQAFPWPIVLRWNADKSAHTLIGLAYVRDIMKGEAFKLQENSQSGVGPFESFTIH